MQIILNYILKTGATSTVRELNTLSLCVSQLNSSDLVANIQATYGVTTDVLVQWRYYTLNGVQSRIISTLVSTGNATASETYVDEIGWMNFDQMTYFEVYGVMPLSDDTYEYAVEAGC